MKSARPENWKVARSLDGVPRGVRWAPLVTRPSTGEAGLGLCEDGEWVVSASNDEELVSPLRRGYLPLLEYLETSPEQFADALRNGLFAAGLPADLADQFPYEGVIQCGLSASDYWAQLAVGWLEARSAHAFSERMKSLLVEAANSPRLSQRTRHRIQRLMKAAG